MLFKMYKKMNNQGVLSVDFIFSFLVIFLVLTGIWALISERVDIAAESEKLSEARILAETVASTINKAHSGGSGHEINVDLPETLKNSNYYFLKVNNSGVYIETDGMVGKAEISPVLIVDGEMKENEVTMKPGRKYKIRNISINGSKNVISIESI